MENVNDLIRELIKIRDKHGNISLKGNDVELIVTGISYKYLLIQTNYPVIQKGAQDGEVLHPSEGTIQK